MEKTNQVGKATENKKFSEHSTRSNGPVKKVKAGAISATIWENRNKGSKGEEITYNSVVVERNYKDAQGNWQKTNSFRTQDLPKVMLVTQKAYEFLAISNEELIKK